MVTYIGCSGWYYKEWKGAFYPEKLPPKNYFSYYTKYFNTVEINSTFYRFPTQKNIQSWHNQAPKHFKYSIKASRDITHIKKFKGVEELIVRLYGIGDILAEKTGCFLFQFPPRFDFTIDRLERIASQLNPIYKNVLEFRHPSWWCAHAADILAKLNMTFCSVSGFGLPQKLMAGGNLTYTRFHGEPVYSGDYSSDELSTWVKNVTESSIQEHWMYFNNTMHGFAIPNASRLKKLLLEV